MREHILKAIETHKKLVDKYSNECVDTIVKAVEMIVHCIRHDGCLYICGNGGSAADAQHIAGELVGRFKTERRALPAVAFTTDTSVITSIANDYSYDDIFARQVEAFVREGDLLWAFSTSGTSSNILAAAKLAKDKGAKVLAFTGRSDTPLEEIADLTLAIDSPSTAFAQEIHQLGYHTICDLVESNFTETQ